MTLNISSSVNASCRWPRVVDTPSIVVLNHLSKTPGIGQLLKTKNAACQTQTFPKIIHKIGDEIERNRLLFRLSHENIEL
jgi:hypothetical protein